MHKLGVFSYILVLLPNFILILGQDANRNNTRMLFLSWCHVKATTFGFITLISQTENLTFNILTVSTYYILLFWKNNCKWCGKMQKLENWIWGSKTWMPNVVMLLPAKTLLKCVCRAHHLIYPQIFHIIPEKQ